MQIENKYNSNSLIPEEYRNINQDIDNFSKIADVESELLYGSLDDTMQPWLSIIVPTYLRTDLLQKALQSIRSQQKVDFLWECIVVDNTPWKNGETLASLKIVRAFEDQRIKLFHNKQSIGGGYNWNRGVELARGEWVCFLHDDDLLCEDALQQIERIILCNRRGRRKPLGYIHARHIEFDKQFDTKTRHKKHPMCIELTTTGALIRGHSQTGRPSCGTTILRKAYLETGGVNYDFGPTADSVLGYQIMKNYTVLLSDCILGGYRWGINETLKRETTLGLVHADFCFANYRYGRNAFSKVWGRLFGKLQYQLNVENKCVLSGKGELKLHADDFAFIAPLSKSSPFLKLLYFGVKAFYLLLLSTKSLWDDRIAFWMSTHTDLQK